MVKTTLATLLFAIFTMLAPYSSLADSLTIQPSAANVSAGDAFSLNVDISGATDLYTFQFDVSFNPALLSATSITEGTFLPSGGSSFFLPGTVDNVGGAITFTADTLLGPGPGVSGSGVLAKIDFRAIGNGASSINLSNLIILDSTGANITTSTANGVVNVGGISSVPEPSSLLMVSAGLLALLGGCRPVAAFRPRQTT